MQRRNLDDTLAAAEQSIAAHNKQVDVFLTNIAESFWSSVLTIHDSIKPTVASLSLGQHQANTAIGTSFLQAHSSYSRSTCNLLQHLLLLRNLFLETSYLQNSHTSTPELSSLLRILHSSLNPEEHEAKRVLVRSTVLCGHQSHRAVSAFIGEINEISTDVDNIVSAHKESSRTFLQRLTRWLRERGIPLSLRSLLYRLLLRRHLAPTRGPYHNNASQRASPGQESSAIRAPKRELEADWLRKRFIPILTVSEADGTLAMHFDRLSPLASANDQFQRLNDCFQANIGSLLSTIAQVLDVNFGVPHLTKSAWEILSAAQSVLRANRAMLTSSARPTSSSSMAEEAVDNELATSSSTNTSNTRSPPNFRIGYIAKQLTKYDNFMREHSSDHNAVLARIDAQLATYHTLRALRPGKVTSTDGAAAPPSFSFRITQLITMTARFRDMKFGHAALQQYLTLNVDAGPNPVQECIMRLKTKESALLIEQTKLFLAAEAPGSCLSAEQLETKLLANDQKIQNYRTAVAALHSSVLASGGSSATSSGARSSSSVLSQLASGISFLARQISTETHILLQEASTVLESLSLDASVSRSLRVADLASSSAERDTSLADVLQRYRASPRLLVQMTSELAQAEHAMMTLLEVLDRIAETEGGQTLDTDEQGKQDCPSLGVSSVEQSLRPHSITKYITDFKMTLFILIGASAKKGSKQTLSFAESSSPEESTSLAALHRMYCTAVHIIGTMASIISLSQDSHISSGVLEGRMQASSSEPSSLWSQSLESSVTVNTPSSQTHMATSIRVHKYILSLVGNLCAAGCAKDASQPNKWNLFDISALIRHYTNLSADISAQLDEHCEQQREIAKQALSVAALLAQRLFVYSRPTGSAENVLCGSPDDGVQFAEQYDNLRIHINDAFLCFSEITSEQTTSSAIIHLQRLTSSFTEMRLMRTEDLRSAVAMQGRTLSSVLNGLRAISVSETSPELRDNHPANFAKTADTSSQFNTTLSVFLAATDSYVGRKVLAAWKRLAEPPQDGDNLFQALALYIESREALRSPMTSIESLKLSIAAVNTKVEQVLSQLESVYSKSLNHVTKHIQTYSVQHKDILETFTSKFLPLMQTFGNDTISTLAKSLEHANRLPSLAEFATVRVEYSKRSLSIIHTPLVQRAYLDDKAFSANDLLTEHTRLMASISKRFNISIDQNTSATNSIRANDSTNNLADALFNTKLIDPPTPSSLSKPFLTKDPLGVSDLLQEALPGSKISTPQGTGSTSIPGKTATNAGMNRNGGATVSTRQATLPPAKKRTTGMKKPSVTSQPIRQKIADRSVK